MTTFTTFANGSDLVNSTDLGNDTDHETIPLYLEMPGHFALMVGTAVVLSLSAVIGTLGNILVIGSICCVRSLRTTGNMFILNLAVADMIVTVIVDPLNAVGAVAGRRILWENYTLCQVVASLCAPACIGSLWNMCAISTNRYILICKPHLYHRIFTFRSCFLWCLGIWILSHLIHLPNHIGWGSNHFSRDYYLCTFDLDTHHFAIFYACVAMVVPLVGVLFGYTAIFLKVRGVRQVMQKHKEKVLARMPNAARHSVDQSIVPGNDKLDPLSLEKVTPPANQDRQRRPTGAAIKKDDVRLAKTLFLAFVVFFVSWAPFAALIMANNPKEVPGWVFVLSIVLGHGNSAVNPILYGLSNKKFRDGYRKLLGNQRVSVETRGGKSFLTRPVSQIVGQDSNEK